MKKVLINYPIIVTKNNKSKEYKIPEIYKGKDWYALNESQKKKVFELWDAIKSEDAGKVDALKLKPKILLVAETIVNAQEAEIVRNRTSQTTANEMFRLTLLMDFPDAKIDWTNAHKPMDRAQLDAMQSGDDDVSRLARPYESLALLYNSDQDTFPVRNICCKYLDDGTKTIEMADPVYVYGNSAEPCDYTTIWEDCRDLDPSIYTERNAAWIQTKEREIRNALNELADPNKTIGFFRSGYQNGQNVLEAWALYVRYKGKPVWQQALFLTNSYADFVVTFADNGKCNSNGADSGLVGEDQLTPTELANNRREKVKLLIILSLFCILFVIILCLIFYSRLKIEKEGAAPIPLMHMVLMRTVMSPQIPKNYLVLSVRWPRQLIHCLKVLRPGLHLRDHRRSRLLLHY